MSEHTDDVIIRQLRETVERQTADNRKLADTCKIINSDRRRLLDRLDAMSSELAELRRLVEGMGSRGDDVDWTGVIWAIEDCRDYNRRKAKQCPTFDT